MIIKFLFFAMLMCISNIYLLFKFQGQVITRVKLGQYFLAKIPRLKRFQSVGESGSVDPGLQALKSLRNALQLLQRYL